MSKVITASIDLTKIDKSKIIEGEKGKYLNIAIIETPNSEYNTHMVVQSQTKEERESGKDSIILGGVKRWDNNNEQTTGENQQQEEIQDDLPF